MTRKPLDLVQILGKNNKITERKREKEREREKERKREREKERELFCELLTRRSNTMTSRIAT